jgi:hypothetical protein
MRERRGRGSLMPTPEHLQCVRPARDLDELAPVKLTRVRPSGVVRLAFWALRVYIAIMVALVAVGFARGLH